MRVLRFEPQIAVNFERSAVTRAGATRVFAETKVRSVYLPETVRELGWFTFYGCGELTSVTLPASITRIGYASFDGCGAELCLVVEKNSYAQQYAASFALRYMTLN